MLLLSILVGILLGECQGLQENLVYQYEYRGTTTTWIPHDPTQSSGAALRATVELQLSQDGDILVKTSDIHVGERHGKGSCHANDDQEFPYRSMEPEDAALLETPFLIHVDRRHGREASYIVVPDEPVWVTNIRRGIASSIPLVVLRGHHLPTLTFRLKEDTMIGSCFNWYSMLKLASHQSKVDSKKLEGLIEVDVQRERVSRYTAPQGKGKKTKSKGRSKTAKTSQQAGAAYTAIPIEDTLSIVTRTLDDENCKDNHFTMMINGNQESVERTQHSSEGAFLVRGEGKVLRLEHAEVTGDTVIYTGESDDEFIRTTTKQVLQLRAVRQLEDVFSITYEPKKRTLSFTVADGPRPTLEEKLLDIYPASHLKEENMARIMEDLSILREVKGMQGEETPVFLKVFQRLVDRMNILSWTEIGDLLARVEGSERLRYIIYQAFLASGRDEVLGHILEEMKDQSFRSNHSLFVFQILQSPNTPVRNAAAFPALLQVVENMGPEEEMERALSLLNIAKLASRYCLNSQRGSNCVPGCDTDFIFQTFLPMLAEGIKDAEKWKRLLSVQAIGALGSPYSIPYLQPIIQGANSEDIDIRISAIYCLTSDLLPNTAVEMVFDSLMPLMNNPSEFPEVRSIAFLVLTTWEPDLSWWEHVAMSTWREKSVQVVSFISSTLTALSKTTDPRSENAKKVVQLAKHPQNSENSLATSTYLYLTEVVKNCQTRGSAKVAWLSSTKSIFPRTLYYQLQLITVMGMTQEEKGVLFASGFSDMYRSYHQLQLTHENYDDWESFQEIFMELSEDLELTLTNNRDDVSFFLLFLSEPVPVLLQNPPGPTTSYMGDFMLLAAVEEIPVHFRLADSTLVFPSELGLPIMIKHEEDFVITLGSSSPNKVVEACVNYFNALKMNTLVPWSSGVAAGAGLEASLDVNLIFRVSGHVKEPIKRFPTIEVELSFENQVKMLSVSNFMYTSLTPLYQVIDSVLMPEPSDTLYLGKKVVWNTEAQVHTSRSLLLPELGIHLESKWNGDSEQPRNLISIFKMICVTQLRYRNFNYTLMLYPERSHTRGVNFTYTMESTEKRGQRSQESDGLSQQTQDGDDFEMFSQVSQSASGFEDFGEDFGQSPVEAVFEEQEQHSQTFYSHLGKMQELTTPPKGGIIVTFVLMVEPQNSTHKYEIAVTKSYARGNINEKAVTKVHVGFIRSPAAGVISDTHLTCLDLKMETPFVLPIFTKEMLLEADLTSSFFINLYNSGNCDGSPELRLQGTFDVSSATKQNVRSTEEVDTCDREFPRQSELLYDQAIIEAAWTQDYENWFTIAEYMIVNQIPFIASKKHEGAPPEDNKLTLQANLDMEKEEWDVTVSTPQATSAFQVCDGPLISPFSSSLVYPHLPDFHKVCHLARHWIRTYDRALHPFEPSPCWTTATIFSEEHELTSGRSVTQIAVQVRFSDQWEVRIIRPSSAVILDVTQSDIKLNEEHFTGDSEKFVVHHLQNKNIMMVEIGLVAVRVGDTVDIMVSDFYHGVVNGVCGNNDGEPVNDMMGPTGCLYTDPALHTIAWNTRGSGCGRLSIRNKKRPLAEYRESCEKVVFQPTGISQQNVMTNCTHWEYDEKRDPTGLYCKTKAPIQKCQPDCHPSRHALDGIMELEYSCQRPSSPGQEEVQYGENNQCFTTTSPIPYSSGCFSL